MQRYGLPTDQLHGWQRSPHANTSGPNGSKTPSCTGCHGAHADASQQLGGVARACGRCHTREQDYFDKSPHSKAFTKKGLGECAVCHDVHDVSLAAQLVGLGADSACSKCHLRDEKPRRVAKELATQVASARGAASQARKVFDDATRYGKTLAGSAAALESLQDSEVRLNAEIHSLDPQAVGRAAARVKRAARDLESLPKSATATRRTEHLVAYSMVVLSGLLFLMLLGNALWLGTRQRNGGS